jgi:trans-2,3-dihydro-3-hydroxyanthranilate isomerase
MRYRFVTADVFTDRAFGGNPLAVLPDARGIGDAAMQKVAREFNLSETVFVLPAEDAGNTRRLRIFTPTRELPFAGHPTVGTALALAWLGEIDLRGEATEIVFEEGAGPVPVTIRASGGQAGFAQLAAPRPPEIRAAPDTADLAALLSLDPSDLRRDAGLPEACSCGLPFLIVEVRDAAALGRARLDHARWRDLLADAWSREVYLITRDAAGLEVDLRVRMFAPAAGIAEDPATGGASGALGCYLLRNNVVTPEQAGAMLSLQGVKMGRPSYIHIAIGMEGGEIASVRVGGESVVAGEGILYL